MRILVIPDAHARPNNSTKRFEALGNYIAEQRPDKVVCIGDWADMGSLCSYDKGHKSAEGRRYSEDIEAANLALGLTMGRVNAGYRSSRKKKPSFYVTGGNHENRITRAADLDPIMHGTIRLDDIRFKQSGWDVVPFLKPLVLDGIVFQHYFTSGVMGKPIGGVNHARALVTSTLQSCVCGHSHLRDFWETTRPDGKKVFGLVVGCFDEGAHEYTTEQKRWWSGLVMLNEVEDGQAEPHFLSLQYLKEKYL